MSLVSSFASTFLQYSAGDKICAIARCTRSSGHSQATVALFLWHHGTSSVMYNLTALHEFCASQKFTVISDLDQRHPFLSLVSPRPLKRFDLPEALGSLVGSER